MTRFELAEKTRIVVELGNSPVIRTTMDKSIPTSMQISTSRISGNVAAWSTFLNMGVLDPQLAAAVKNRMAAIQA